MAKRFCNTVRYIDDLLALNNKKFEEEIVTGSEKTTLIARIVRLLDPLRSFLVHFQT